MSKDQGIKYICDCCGELIEVGRPRFIIKGELFCAYDGAQFDETLTMPPGKLQDEIRRLMEAAEQKSEKELNDEVHYPFQRDLCRACRDRIYRMLESQE